MTNYAIPTWPSALQAEFDRLYAEPHRCYHTQAHVRTLLALFERHKDLVEAHEEIEAAIWFHDAFYDPGRSDNETRSAEFASVQLRTLGWPRTRIQRVAKMVLATQTHPLQEFDADTQFFLDLDLSILGACPGDYGAYCVAIRREYAAVPEPIYRDKRREVLQRFVDRTILFGTPELAQQWETQARHNLHAELLALASPDP
jgi:predicted metal-dependent HD superfamily phosphohydrolase